MPTDKKLDHFTDMVLARAGELADTIDEESKQRRDEVLSTRKDEYLAGLYHEIRTQAADIRAQESRRVAKTAMECRRTLYARRAALETEMRALLRTRLVTLTQDEQRYGAYLVSRCRTAAARVGDADCTLALRPEDMSLAAVLRPLFKGRVSLREERLSIGGVLVDCPAHNILIDLSLDSAFNEAAAQITELVAPKKSE